MERSNFIKLLEEYRNKAIAELHKESRVQASLLISGEFKSAILELETASKIVNSGLRAVSAEVNKITTQNALPDYSGYYGYNTVTTAILENVVICLSQRIRCTTTFKQKENEIRSKFDAAIRAAKATRSAAKLKELADALGIETPSIEVTSSVSATVDTEFVKEKIKSVLLLS